MKVFRILAKVFRIAYDIAGGLIFGVFVGFWLDKWLKTNALFIIVLSLWGVVHGFKMMLKIGE